MIPIDENLEVIVEIRMFPSKLKEIDDIIKYDKWEVFSSRSHFFRAAANYFMNSKKVREMIDYAKEQENRNTNKIQLFKKNPEPQPPKQDQEAPKPRRKADELNGLPLFK